MSIEKDLSDFRIDQAKECLITAKLNYDNCLFRGAANRAYYCVFNSMRSLLALERIDFKSHHAIISHFRKHYIKTGIFETKLSKIIDETFEKRTDGDYEDFVVISKEEAAQQIENAEYFLNKIKEYLETNQKGDIL